jgi:FkbM family methyltransferase
MNKLKKCRYGDMVYPVNDVYVGRSLELYGEYSEGEVALFRAVVKKGDTVLDVGANLGAHSVALANLVGPHGRVIAFEPQRLLFYCLCANVALNNLHQVLCHQAAAGETDTTIFVPELHPEKEQNFGSLELTQEHPTTQGQLVPVRRIDDLRLATCHFLKIDVEGMEQKVLAGAIETIRRHRPVLYVEDDRSERSEAVQAQLDRLAYTLFLHRPSYFNPDNYFKHAENVFGNTVSRSLFCHPREMAPPIDPKAFDMVRLAPAGSRKGGPSPASVPELMGQALQLHQGGDLSRAETLYASVLQLDPGHAQAWYLRGAACHKLGRLDDAEVNLRQAVRLQPGHAEAHNHLGVTLASKGKMEEAAGSFQQALRLKSDYAEAEKNLQAALRQKSEGN